MKKAIHGAWRLSIGALFLTVSAFAGTTVSMTLSSVGTDVMGNIYVNAYMASVNGVSTQVICDDFVDDSYVHESWQATTYTFADLGGSTANSNVKWNATTSTAIANAGSAAQQAQTQLKLYEEAAWLSLQLLATNNPVIQGEISYAIWGVFDPPAISSWLKGYSTTDATAAQSWVTLAAQQTYTAGEFANFTIYTPNANPKPTCSGGPCPTGGLPQEFLSVAMPEPPLWAMVGFELSGVLAMVWALRRRLSRAS